MVISFDLTYLTEQPQKLRVANTLCILAIVKSAACFRKVKLSYGFLGSGINVGFFISLCMSAIVVFMDKSSTYELTSIDFTSSSWSVGILWMHSGYFSWYIFVSNVFAKQAKLPESLYPNFAPTKTNNCNGTFLFGSRVGYLEPLSGCCNKTAECRAPCSSSRWLV